MPLGEGCAVTLKQPSRFKVNIKNLHSDHIFSPLGQIWFILHPQSDFGQRVRSDVECSFEVKVISDQIKTSLSIADISP